MNSLGIVILALAALSAPCSAQTELARSASAYRRLAAIRDTMQLQVRVPGAPMHEESVAYGWLGDRSLMRMPQRYAIQLRGNEFTIAEDGRRGHVAAEVRDDPQAALDTAFGGAGSPVIPPPILLRRATSFDEQMQAFRLKVLGRFKSASCADDTVTLNDDNGSVTFRVGHDGLIRQIQARISTAPGQPEIRAAVTFDPQPGERPAPLAITGEAVRTVSELDAAAPATTLPDIALKDLDGNTVPLRDPQGRTTVLEFWATWCAPCRLTLPKVEAFARSRKDIRVLLVNFQEDSERVQPYLKAANITGSVVLDADGSVHNLLGSGLPLTVVLSADGRILKTHAGFDDQVELWLRTIR